MLVASIVGVDMRATMDIDTSTDDVITPKAVEYDYKLMFEDRTISVLTYNKETLLAEKMQTIINRGIANTRLRDLYDVYSIMNFYGEQIEKPVLYDAFSATCEKRKTIFTKDDIEATLHLVSDDLHMADLWEKGVKCVTLGACGESVHLYQKLGFHTCFNNIIMKYDGK